MQVFHSKQSCIVISHSKNKLSQKKIKEETITLKHCVKYRQNDEKMGPKIRAYSAKTNLSRLRGDLIVIFP